MSSFSFNGGHDGGPEGGQNGGFGPPPETSTPSAQISTVLSSSSATLSPSAFPSSSSSSAESTTTVTALLSATGRPPPPTSHTSSLPLGLIIGGSVGGMVLGALLVTLFFYWRRRAQQKARRSQAQLGSKQDQDAEKGAPLITPFIVPPVPVVPNAKVADWMRRNRHVSVSTISSFSSPTVIESVGERSSISAYSQSSAPRNGMAGHPARPEGPLHPGLDSINE